MTLRAYRITDGASIVIPNADGKPAATATARRVGGEVIVTASPGLDYTVEVIE